MIDTKQHPATRAWRDAVAYTTEEGGVWIKGPPPWGAGPHTVVFADGWAWDRALCHKNINRGARRVSVMPVFDENGASLPIAMDVGTEELVDLVQQRLTAVEQRLSNLELQAAGNQAYPGLRSSFFGP